MKMKIAEGWQDRSGLLCVHPVPSIVQACFNDVYSAQLSVVKSSMGMVHHAWIRRHDEVELTWKEKQYLKNVLFGEDYTAIEIYPREKELVDTAMMYHLWVMPFSFCFDFGLHLKNEQLR